MIAVLAVAGQGNVFKELPHSLEVVDVSNAEPTAPRDVSKVCSCCQLRCFDCLRLGQWKNIVN